MLQRMTKTMGPWSNFVDSIASKLAFFPPQPSTYRLEEHTDGRREYYILPTLRGLPKVFGCEVVRLDTKRGSTIVGAYFPLKGWSTYRVPTILYSHGNAVDLGVMLASFKEFGRELRVALMCYDYTGYGASTGQPSVANTLADIDAAYSWLRGKGVEPSQIVLYGQSVGSGPTAYLAAKEKLLAGVILHSPLASGMRVLNPTWRWWPKWADVYSNVAMVPQIDAPLVVIHGRKDEVIDFRCGEMLHRLAKNPYEPLWEDDSDHQNVELSLRYKPHVKRFLAHAFGPAYRS